MRFHIKPEIRVMGVDDGAPVGNKTPLVGVVLRGNKWVEGVLKSEITPDGMDVTDKLIEMVRSSRQRGQLRVIMSDGITFAGFNILDVHKVFEELGLPLIAVSRTRPNLKDIRKALRNLPDWKERWNLIKRSGSVHPFRSPRRRATIYIQSVGIEPDTARQIVELTLGRSSIPEPIRIAHMVATAIVKGESHGGA